MRKVCDCCRRGFVTTPDDDTPTCDDCIRDLMTGEAAAISEAGT